MKSQVSCHVLFFFVFDRSYSILVLHKWSLLWPIRAYPVKFFHANILKNANLLNFLVANFCNLCQFTQFQPHDCSLTMPIVSGFCHPCQLTLLHSDVFFPVSTADIKTDAETPRLSTNTDFLYHNTPHHHNFCFPLLSFGLLIAQKQWTI